MEVIRSKPSEDMRVRGLRARQLLRGDIEGDDLEKYVEERVLLTRLEDAQNLSLIHI